MLIEIIENFLRTAFFYPYLLLVDMQLHQKLEITNDP